MPIPPQFLKKGKGKKGKGKEKDKVEESTAKPPKKLSMF